MRTFDLQGGSIRVTSLVVAIALVAATFVGSTPITVTAAPPDKPSLLFNLTSATITATADLVAPTVVKATRTTKALAAVMHRRASAPASCGCSGANSGEQPRKSIKVSKKRLATLLAHLNAKKRSRATFSTCRDTCRDDTIICLIAAGLLCTPCAAACLIGEYLCLRDCGAPEEN
jgi:hypothetical protein